LGVSKILTDPKYLAKFGYGPAAVPPKKADAPKDEAKEAGAPVEAAKESTPASEPVEAAVGAPAEAKENGVTPETQPEITETLLKATDGEVAQAVPTEIVNAA
jgi:hypothetical protein